MGLFDHRWDGNKDRALLSICLPSAETLILYSVSPTPDNRLEVTRLSQMPAISNAAIRATRHNVWDLLIVKPNHEAAILTHGTLEVPIEFNLSGASTPDDDESGMQVDQNIPDSLRHPLVSVKSGYYSTATLTFVGGLTRTATFSLIPEDSLTLQALQILALSLPHDMAFQLHTKFLSLWAAQGLRTSDAVEFDCLSSALISVFELDDPAQMAIQTKGHHPWVELADSPSHRRLREDPVLRVLKAPNFPSFYRPLFHKRHSFLGPVLYALHTLGENLRLMVHGYKSVLRLAPLICRIALIIRPEWADYWKRLCPEACTDWPSSQSIGMCLCLLRI